ncbi:MAG: CRISPR-associated protein Cas4 [candidate division Zixibacteria bacterium]|nr:CRISPR-associated protein Cas4 [candidate division Zixibacteria bacterium]
MSQQCNKFTEDDLQPISALQHLAFCERQWGLMYLENIWAENRLTAEGTNLHERADLPETESRTDLRIARSLRLRSLRYGLTGIADIVEFQLLTGDESKQAGVVLESIPGRWQPMPVEYKRGRPKISRCDEVQLCGQVLCLEEMLNIVIETGKIFYGQPRRRHDVAIDNSLRAETFALIDKLHKYAKKGQTPIASYHKKCESCSIKSFCLPKVTGSKSVRKYLARIVAEINKGNEV